jgi:NarL family two-component system sensor histidine kinase LiaS
LVPRELAAGPRAATRLGGLRWRLTISYALVTLVAAATMSAATAVAQAARGVISADRAGAATILEKSAGAAAPYLTGPVPDPDAIRFWVAIPLMDDLSRQAYSRPLAVAVFDGNGTLLTAESCTQRQRTASSAVTCRTDAQARVEALLADPAAQRAIQSAVHARGNGQSITGSVSGRGFAATPIPGGKQPGGALVAIFDGGVPVAPRQHPIGAFITAWKASWSPTWLPLIMLALVLGTATGLALSHQLVRRLRAMAATARTWSRGDLHPTVDAHGRDELAHLGADLNRMAEQIRNLLAVRREIATMQERHRVQRDLHDGVKQELFAASMHLAAARASLHGEANGTLGHLDEAQASTRRAQRELTAIIDQLRPPPLSPHGLATTVAELCTLFEHQAGIPLERDMPPSLHLSQPVEEALIRIIQEALTNIRRHANASTATISLTTHDNQLTLLITDDGHGLPPDPSRTGGLGLTSMRERAEAVRGSFDVRPNHPGTIVEVILPTDSGEPAHA